jgi:hypothetical protein
MWKNDPRRPGLGCQRLSALTTALLLAQVPAGALGRA